MNDQTVAVIVVTFRRPSVVVETVKSVASQTRRPDLIVVVDNGADGSTEKSLNDAGLTVDLVQIPDNIGFAGGLEAGMRYAKRRLDPDQYWLMDDDSPVEKGSLARVLKTASSIGTPAVIASRGAHLNRGRISLVVASRTAPPVPIDLCLVDGTLVPRQAVDEVGMPDSRLFMMFEDFEYSLRLRGAGIPRYLAPAVESQARNLGSSGTWRSYYLARNHLRAALDHRSPVLVLGALDRCIRQIAFAFIHRKSSRWITTRLRVRGLLDAVLGRMGRTIEPSDYP
jgi:rhamnopyranosyl-N-acetylglucosaminyl-diphospho-decaprenol beta-1,3/1,4-galactofuranosyltransferase